jgi:hypothetical protein
MQNAMRRTLGVGGAAAVAIAASLALAGVASAHNHDVTAQCVTDTKSTNYGKSALTVSLTNYADSPNSVVVTETAGSATPTALYSSKDFTPQYVHTFYEDGTLAESYEVKVVANSKQFSFDSVVTTKVCPQSTTTTPPTETTTPTQPPTETPSSSSAPTTTAAAVAPVSTKTPPSGGLAYTGVSTELPLIIGGVLIVLGAGALIAMRIMKRRRAES